MVLSHIGNNLGFVTGMKIISYTDLIASRLCLSVFWGLFLLHKLFRVGLELENPVDTPESARWAVLWWYHNIKFSSYREAFLWKELSKIYMGNSRG